MLATINVLKVLGNYKQPLLRDGDTCLANVSNSRIESLGDHWQPHETYNKKYPKAAYKIIN